MQYQDKNVSGWAQQQNDGDKRKSIYERAIKMTQSKHLSNREKIDLKTNEAPEWALDYNKTTKDVIFLSLVFWEEECRKGK